MSGYIYIAGSFHNINRSHCGQGGQWIDNDPHFWSSPPTWGICRPDLRERVETGDTVFFVLPLASRHPQTIFGYLTVKEKITHLEAFNRAELRDKRMGHKNPNGNIIVDEHGNYNRFDAGAHRYNFERIKRQYVIGDISRSEFLTDIKIRRQAPNFLSALGAILHRSGSRPIDLISRYGSQLTDSEVSALIQWLGRRPRLDR